MKKCILTLAVIVSQLGNAQTTIFQENWDGQGPGISAWTLYNLDNRTPVGPSGTDGQALSYLIQNAWNVLTPTQINGAFQNYSYPTNATGMAGNVVASNSWYTPAGASNDWLVSPQITIPTGATDVNLTWAATSLGDTAYLEDYKVYISTSGNQVSDFTTLLLNVQNESNTGSFRTVNLSNYVGQNVRIAFRNDSNDQYVMFLDNIKITANNILGIDEISKSKTNFYPNPTKGEINIKTDKKIKSTTISDLSGKVLSKGNKEKINVSDFTKGTYIIKVEFTDGTIKTEKIIKE